jgi:ABC-2 type transport system permease protein
MSTAAAAPVLVAPPVQRTAPLRAVSGLALRGCRRGGAVLVVATAGMTAVVTATYGEVTASAPGGVSALAVLAGNPAIRTLFGEPVALDTAGGFTVWRTGAALGVLLGVWALLTATRLLRGEEDAGRWTLLAAGPVRAGAMALRVLLVVVAVPVLAGAGAAAALLAAGEPGGGALVHGAGLALTGAFYAAVGGLAAQVFPRRAAAAGAATAVLAAGLLSRMVGDGLPELGWLRWLSPFGLTALAAPFHTDRVVPLVVLAAAAAAAVALVPLLADRRDVGEGYVRPGRRRSRLALLGSPTAFAARGATGPLLGWSVGVGAYFLLIGLLTVSLTGFLADNASFADLAAQAGFADLDRDAGYAATLFALLALPVGAFATARIGALAADEAARRLALLLAGPLTRTRLLVAHAGVAAAAAAALTAVAGTAFWAGAAVAGSPLTLGDALAGAFNTLPVALLALGAAVLALGWVPRATVAVGAVPVVGGFSWHVIAGSTGAPRWVADVSPFAHLAAVPAAPASVPATVVMLCVAAAATAVGLVGYRRRDLRSA